MESRNRAALALRNLKSLYPSDSQEIEHVEALTSKAPFFGFIDIEIEDILFSMFSNNDDFVAKSYFWNGKNAYESTSLRIWSALAKKSSHIIDIGSYSGVYSLAAAQSNKKSKIYAVEALDRVYSRLIINKKANEASNLRCFNIAMSNKNGEIELHVYSGEDILVSGSTTIAESTTRQPCDKRLVKSVTLDQFIADQSIPRVELLKIDAEGAEHHILSGGGSILRNSKPDIICELLPSSCIEEIQTQLRSIGYRYYKISESSSTLVEHEIPPASVEPPDFNILITAKSEQELEATLPFLTFKHLS